MNPVFLFANLTRGHEASRLAVCVTPSLSIDDPFVTTGHMVIDGAMSEIRIITITEITLHIIEENLAGRLLLGGIRKIFIKPQTTTSNGPRATRHQAASRLRT